MNIHLNNYEEYFLLYADDELTPEQRLEVESFINEHPQYRSELLALLQTIQQPEKQIRFADKTSLYRKEDSNFINAENYESIFVQFHDGELNTEEQQLTEEFIRQHPQYAGAFGLLQTVRFTPDTSVVFHDKTSLYKKRAAKVIPMRSWKYMAAALLAGLILWAAFFLVKPAPRHELVLNPEKAQPQQGPVIEKQKSGKLQDENNIATLEPSKRQQPQEGDIPIDNSPGIPPKSKPLLVVHKEKAALPIPKELARNQNMKEEQGLAEISNPTMVNSLEMPEVTVLSENSAQKVAPINKITEENSKMLRNTLTESSDENYIFYNVPQEEFKKSRVGIFLKQVKRTVVRNNPIYQLFDNEKDGVALK